MGATVDTLDAILAGRPYGPVVQAVARATARIRDGFATRALSGKAGSRNASGDEQDAMDVWADGVVEAEARSSGLVGAYASEERDAVVQLGGRGFSLACDPLDGSSNIPINLPVGTIFSVYPDGFESKRGADALCAGYVLYGPLTVMVLATDAGVDELALDGGRYVVRERGLRLPPGKDFVVSDSKKRWTPGYARFVERCYAEGCKARNTASMVADFHRALRKGGIYTYPGTEKAPEGKIRLLFEAAPMSFIASKAGGLGHDGREEMLRKTVCAPDGSGLHARTPVFVGSRNLAEIALQEMGR